MQMASGLDQIRNKYRYDLLLKVVFDNIENRYILAYYSDRINFSNEELLFDLMTVVDESGLDNMTIYFDSEREMI